MRITNLRIQNYRGLRDVEIPFSHFGCLIGENNAGKSSVLQALSLFFSGSSLACTNFFDEKNEIRIEVTFCDVSEVDLARLSDTHRPRLEPLIINGVLRLARIYGTDGKGKLHICKQVPNEPRFSEGNLHQLMHRQRAGQNFCQRIVEEFPELSGRMTVDTDQAGARALIDELAASLPDGLKQWEDADLPTGIEGSIKALFPEPIYIPAVKDLADDIKTRESATFGKVLKILLDAIEPELKEAGELFEKLNEKLNRIRGVDGIEYDNRLPHVKLIEETVEQKLQQSFPRVWLRIEVPPPNMKTVLSSAQIVVDDGVPGDLDSKGDGLRRSVIFAILRSYVELSAQNLLQNLTQKEGEEQGEGEDEPKTVDDANRYLLLFEEPELFLHPTAQQILFNTLGEFAKRHTWW